MNLVRCDFCGKEADCIRTHFGSSFGYVRLACPSCAKEFEMKPISDDE